MQKPKKNTALWFATYGVFSLLSYSTEEHLPGVGTSHSGLDFPTHINNQSSKCLTDLPTGHSGEDYLFLEDCNLYLVPS